MLPLVDLVLLDPLTLFRKDRTLGEQRWHATGSAPGAVLLVVDVYRVEDSNEGEENIRIVPRGKQTSVRAESIFSKPVNKAQKSVLSRIAKRQSAGDESGIDYSEIPRLTDDQLAQFKRAPKVLVDARIDKEVTTGS